MLSRRLLRIKTTKALYAHFKSESTSLITSEKNLMFSVNKTYELYHLMLWLTVDVVALAGERIDLGLQKHLPTDEEKNPNTKFIENKVINIIRNDQGLIDYLERYKLGWVRYPELIKKLYNELLDSGFYKNYMSETSRSFREDQKLIEDFFINIISASEAVEEAVEEQSIYWADDVDFTSIMVIRTLGNMKESSMKVPLLPQFKNEEDKEFAKQLFRYSLVGHKEYFEIIDKFTKNWDVERIAFMDNLIMATAIAEIINFPSIPVKVTFDEFIEIAKYYSTPGSSLFINGVLDKIIESLQSEKRIEKTGRGLLEK